MVGLACSSPEPELLPGTRAVVMLSGESDPLFVPAARPSMSFSATISGSAASRGATPGDPTEQKFDQLA